jgi:hypothetical protein
VTDPTPTPDPSGNPAPTPDPDPTPDPTPDPAPTPDPQPEPSPEPSSTVTVDADAFAEMQSRLATLEERDNARAQEAHAAARTQDVDAGISSGRFPEARRGHYAARYDSDPEGTRAEIEALTPGVVPTGGRRMAASASPAPSADAPKPGEANPNSLLTPAERARRAA